MAESVPIPQTPAKDMKAPAPAEAPSLPAALTPAPPTLRSPPIVDQRAAVHDSLHTDTWQVTGSSKVLGDAVIREGRIDGMASVKGSLTATRLAVSGTLEVDGPVRITEGLDLEGVGRFGSALQAGTLNLRGLIDVGGTVTAQATLTVTGRIAASGKVSAGGIVFRGSLATDADWAAKSVEGRLEGKSRARTIRAGSVHLRRDGAFRKGTLTVDRIEATEVSLEDVEAEHVHADRIILGRGCHIAEADGLVVKRHRSSTIGFESRSEPPPGLTR